MNTQASSLVCLRRKAKSPQVHPARNLLYFSCMSLFNKVLQAKRDVMYKIFYSRLSVVPSHKIAIFPKLLVYGPRADNPQFTRSAQAIRHRKGFRGGSNKTREGMAVHLHIELWGKAQPMLGTQGNNKSTRRSKNSPQRYSA